MEENRRIMMKITQKIIIMFSIPHNFIFLSEQTNTKMRVREEEMRRFSNKSERRRTNFFFQKGRRNAKNKMKVMTCQPYLHHCPMKSFKNSPELLLHHHKNLRKNEFTVDVTNSETQNSLHNRS